MGCEDTLLPPLRLPIAGLTPFTMLDFPDRLACIVWFSGCNLRCRYCHNPELIIPAAQKSGAEIFDFLKTRRGKLDGVVLSGGEATCASGLADFIRDIRTLGFAVKLDTNGLRPAVLELLLDEGLLDYVALDYKAPPQKFRAVTGTGHFSEFEQSLALLCSQAAVPVEVRTTVHTHLLDEADIAAIISDLEQRGYGGAYYVQNFRADNGRPTLANLPEQERVLDIASLPRPRGFSCGFRNFTAVPVDKPLAA